MVISMNKKKLRVQALFIILGLCFLIGVGLFFYCNQQKAQRQVTEILQQLDIATISQIKLALGPNEIDITDSETIAYITDTICQLEIIGISSLHELAPGATAYRFSFKLLNDDLIVVTLPYLTLSVNGRAIGGYYQINNDVAIVNIIDPFFRGKGN